MKKTNLLAVTLVLSSIPQLVVSQSNVPRKNVLFIAVDDLKPLLNCYGDKMAITPTIDKLAEQGTVFTAAYCQQAISGPTRVSLLTGKCPDYTHVWDLKTLMRDMNPAILTLPQHYKNNNYFVAGIGKIYDPRTVDKGLDTLSWSIPFINHADFLSKTVEKPVMAHYQSDEIRSLYNRYYAEALESGLKGFKAKNWAYKKIKRSTECVNVPDDAYLDGATAEGAVQFIKEYTEDKPFFFAVGFKKPHLPFCAPEKYWNLYKREEIQLAAYRKRAIDSPSIAYHKSGELNSYSDIPDLASFNDIDNMVLKESKAKELIHGYYACVSYMDAQVAKVIEALNEKGLAENTIIVFWGDHGWHLGDHGMWNKHSNFEQATRVPMLIVDPSVKVKKVNTPVEFLDLFPTLCDLSGVKKPKNLDGESLAPLLKGEVTEASIKPYAVSQYPRGKRMGYSIRDKRFRYTVWVSWKNKKTDTNNIFAEEFYDYKKDPNETRNVVNDVTYVKNVALLKSYWKEYCLKIMNK